MTKEEAISQMKSGAKMTHEYFTEEEWVKTDQTGRIYILEDGAECSFEEFWRWRATKDWDNGWSFYKAKQGQN